MVFFKLEFRFFLSMWYVFDKEIYIELKLLKIIYVLIFNKLFFFICFMIEKMIEDCKDL